jgi:hypothetical protein
MGEGDGFAIVEKFFQAVDQLQDVHRLLCFPSTDTPILSDF